jgi:phosphopantetheinyl transferase (holo-ACP synthase)
MIGNDIVDLLEAKASPNWQTPRFLEKLFTINEQSFILNSKNSFENIWQLWSMKEAAYKLYVQTNPCRFYNPKAFECSFINGRPRVKFQDFECILSTVKTPNYILSEARLDKASLTSKVIKLAGQNQKNRSEETKLALLHHISKTCPISKQNPVFQKNEFGIPLVNHNSKQFSVSLSHHGSYGAFAVA